MSQTSSCNYTYITITVVLQQDFYTTFSGLKRWPSRSTLKAFITVHKAICLSLLVSCWAILSLQHGQMMQLLFLYLYDQAAVVDSVQLDEALCFWLHSHCSKTQIRETRTRAIPQEFLLPQKVIMLRGGNTLLVPPSLNFNSTGYSNEENEQNRWWHAYLSELAKLWLMESHSGFWEDLQISFLGAAITKVMHLISHKPPL